MPLYARTQLYLMYIAIHKSGEKAGCEPCCACHLTPRFCKDGIQRHISREFQRYKLHTSPWKVVHGAGTNDTTLTRAAVGMPMVSLVDSVGFQPSGFVRQDELFEAVNWGVHSWHPKLIASQA